MVAIAAESQTAVDRYLSQHPVPYLLLSDADHRVFDAYDVASRALSLGQRPALFVIDRHGIVRFDAVATQQWQDTDQQGALGVLATLSEPPPTA